MITVPWEKRIICLGVQPVRKTRLLADMHAYVRDRPYSESNYRRFIAAWRKYGYYSCCLDFDTMAAESDGLSGEWISAGGLTDGRLFMPSFSNYALPWRDKVAFFTGRPNVFRMILNMDGRLLYTSDDLNNDPRPDAKRIFGIVKERLLGTTDHIESDAHRL